MLLTVFGYLGLWIAVWLAFENGPVEDEFASVFVPVHSLPGKACSLIIDEDRFYVKSISTCRLYVSFRYGWA